MMRKQPPKPAGTPRLVLIRMARNKIKTQPHDRAAWIFVDGILARLQTMEERLQRMKDARALHMRGGSVEERDKLIKFLMAEARAAGKRGKLIERYVNEKLKEHGLKPVGPDVFKKIRAAERLAAKRRPKVPKTFVAIDELDIVGDDGVVETVRDKFRPVDDKGRPQPWDDEVPLNKRH